MINMKRLEEVNTDLKKIRYYYKNYSALKNVESLSCLVEKYYNVISLAPAELVTYYVYYYQHNFCNKVVADKMSLSLSYITKISSYLKIYLSQNLI